MKELPPPPMGNIYFVMGRMFKSEVILKSFVTDSCTEVRGSVFSLETKDVKSERMSNSFDYQFITLRFYRSLRQYFIAGWNPSPFWLNLGSPNIGMVEDNLVQFYRSFSCFCCLFITPMRNWIKTPNSRATELAHLQVNVGRHPGVLFVTWGRASSWKGYSHIGKSTTRLYHIGGEGFGR